MLGPFRRHRSLVARGRDPQPRALLGDLGDKLPSHLECKGPNSWHKGDKQKLLIGQTLQPYVRSMTAGLPDASGLLDDPYARDSTHEGEVESSS